MTKGFEVMRENMANKIADMIIQGASEKDVMEAVKETMAAIDSYKNTPVAKKVFLSFPMSDKSWSEISGEYAFMYSFLKDDETPVDNTDCGLPEDAHRLKKLGVALSKIADCDVILMHPDWEDYKGCRLEHSAAYDYGIKVEYIQKVDGKYERRDAYEQLD